MYTELFYDHPYLVSILFAEAICYPYILLRFFFLFLFMSLFLVADACLSWSLPSFTEQQVSPHRLPMQYWLKNRWLSSNTLHTNSISNSAKSNQTHGPPQSRLKAMSTVWCLHSFADRSCINSTSQWPQSFMHFWLSTVNGLWYPFCVETLLIAN